MIPTATSNSNGALDSATPDLLSPHERLRELTAILANGIHRLRANPSVTPECHSFPAESSENGLDCVTQTRPDGVVLTQREKGEQ